MQNLRSRPDMRKQKLNFSRYPVIYVHVNIWEALVQKHLDIKQALNDCTKTLAKSFIAFWYQRGMMKIPDRGAGKNNYHNDEQNFFFILAPNW